MRNIIIILVCMASGIQMLFAQSEKRIEVNASFNNSLPLIIERNYLAVPNNGDITSSHSPGFEIDIRYVQSIKRRLAWTSGIHMGLYSYHFNLNIPVGFISALPDGFTDNYTQYEIPYMSLQSGVRYSPWKTNKGSLFVDLSLRLTYHVRSYGDISSSVIANDGQIRQFFYAESINNGNNGLLIAPEAGMFYMTNLPNSRVNFFTGFHAVVSRQTPLSGSYFILGDSTTLEGSFKKRYILPGVSLGVSIRACSGI